MSVLYAHIQLIKFSECIELHFSNDLCTVIQGHSVRLFIEHPGILEYAKMKHQHCLTIGYKLPCNYITVGVGCLCYYTCLRQSQCY